MQVVEAIKKRRSIRSYSERPVSWDLIADILDAAHYAPSSGNVQDWRFIVIKKDETIKEIAKIADQDWIAKVPVLIVVCSDLPKVKRLFGNNAETFSAQNVAAAVQNMLLRAYDLGLGSCWIADFNEKDLIKLLDIKAGIKPYTIVSLGYTRGKVKEIERDELDTMTFFEEYGVKKNSNAGIMPLEKSLKNSLERVKEILSYGKEKVKDIKEK